MNIFDFVSTLGYIGYLPASGTMATILALFFIIIFKYINVNLLLYFLILFVINVIGFYSINIFLKKFKYKDPSEIVIDEFIGCLVSFFNIPINTFNIILGFFIFRLLDIFKPLGLKKCEDFSGALGVIADDFAAGIITNILLFLTQIILNPSF